MTIEINFACTISIQSIDPYLPLIEQKVTKCNKFAQVRTKRNNNGNSSKL